MIAIASPRCGRSMAVCVALTLILKGATVLAASPAPPHVYATPDEAAAALDAAMKGKDSKAVLAVLGQAAAPLISSGDPVADENARAHFVEQYDGKHSIVAGANGQSVLQVGTDDWPFPIPLVKNDAGWHFDAAAGAEEVLNRRIGRNELSAIQACLAYVDAQREYYQRNADKSPLLHYAQLLSSTAGKRDGLYWKTSGDEEESPLGPAFARARTQGYSKVGSGSGDPFYGYYYRVLTAQGPAAAGGAYDYMAKGKMIGGFALVAFPAKWDNSGVMTFIVNQDGVVFQKDLGADTVKLAKAMKIFNPDETWQRVQPGSPAAAASS